MSHHKKPKPEHHTASGGNQIPAHHGGDSVGGLPPVLTPPQPPEPPAPSNPASNDSSKFRANLKLCIELVGLTALIVYTIFSILQWAQIRWTNRLTREALNTTEESQGQIQQQTTLMRQQLEGTVAAVIDVNANISEDGAGSDLLGPHAEIALMNTGQLIAHDIHVSATIKQVTLPDMRQVGGTTPFQFSVPELIPRKDKWDQHQRSFELSPQSLELLLDTKRTIRLDIAVTYNDGFSGQARNYCYAFLGARTPIKKVLLSHTTIKCDDVADAVRATEFNKAHRYANE